MAKGKKSLDLRDVGIVWMIAEGQTNEKIARHLNISAGHLSRLVNDIRRILGRAVSREQMVHNAHIAGVLRNEKPDAVKEFLHSE